MKKLLATLLITALCSCTQKSASQAGSSESQAESSAPVPAAADTAKSFQALVESGDSSACANDVATQMILDKVRPNYPNQGTLNFMSNARHVDISKLTEENFKQARDNFGSVGEIVMSDFNAQTKKMSCSASFSDPSQKKYPVTYTLQPTADHSDVLINMESEALTPMNNEIFMGTIINGILGQ